MTINHNKQYHLRLIESIAVSRRRRLEKYATGPNPIQHWLNEGNRELYELEQIYDYLKKMPEAWRQIDNKLNILRGIDPNAGSAIIKLDLPNGNEHSLIITETWHHDN